MINLVREREQIGMTSPWRRTPKRDGSHTPGYATPGNMTPSWTTPRHSSAAWSEADMIAYLTPARDYASSHYGGSRTPYRGSATPRRPPEFMGSSDIPDPAPATPGRGCATPRRSTISIRDAPEMMEMGTPRRVTTMMGREIDLGGYKSPQRPHGGTNNWGGASPLISRNVPEETRDTTYVRFNPLSDLNDDGDDYSVQIEKKMAPRAVQRSPGRYDGRNVSAGGRPKRRGFFSRLKWWKRGKKVLA